VKNEAFIGCSQCKTSQEHVQHVKRLLLEAPRPSKPCSSREHIDSIDKPGFCVWCDAPLKCDVCGVSKGHATSCPVRAGQLRTIQDELLPPWCGDCRCAHEPGRCVGDEGLLAQPCKGHVSDPKNPGICKLCGAPCESRPRGIKPSEIGPLGNVVAADTTFVDFAATNASALSVLLRAVAYGAILTLGPGTRRGDFAGTLEQAFDPRFAMAQGENLSVVLSTLAAKWERA
jgi:hypothetical protein